jgi:nitrous-oxide reductase
MISTDFFWKIVRIIPVFSQFENGWGYSEETKPMLNTSHGCALG